MEGGAVTLELTFREVRPDPSSARAKSRGGSPKPRTGWYGTRRSSAGSRARHRSPSSRPAGTGWASTDADQQALRWHPVGSVAIPEFETCSMLPWITKRSIFRHEDGEVKSDRAEDMDGEAGDAPWTELGVYPPGDSRKVRQALLLGFHASAGGPNPVGDCDGYVVALSVKVGEREGLSVTEICRIPLEAGHEPVTFNREKLPPGAPTIGRAAVEAVCADGWIRRWYLVGDMDSEASMGGANHRVTETSPVMLCKVDLCQPFGNLNQDNRADVNPGASKASPETAMLAMASSSLLAVAQQAEPQQRKNASVKSKLGCKPEPLVGVWSCSTSPYPKNRFKKEGSVAFEGVGKGKAVDGMCWVSPEAGDERGAAVGGYCLCVSVGGTVTVFARETKERPPAGKGLLTAGSVGYSTEDASECTWSPIFRVANPCLLLACSTAGLRDFCQVNISWNAF